MSMSLRLDKMQFTYVLMRVRVYMFTYLRKDHQLRMTEIFLFPIILKVFLDIGYATIYGYIFISNIRKKVFINICPIRFYFPVKDVIVFQ